MGFSWKEPVSPLWICNLTSKAHLKLHLLKRKKKSFTEIEITYHTIHMTKGYNAMAFSVFTELGNRLPQDEAAANLPSGSEDSPILDIS